MTIFLENIAVWLAISFLVLMVGWGYYQHTGHYKKSLMIGLGGVLLFGLGIYLVYGIETDRQKLTRIVRTLGKAIESNDVNQVVSLLADDAIKTKAKAHLYMGVIHTDWVKIRDVKVMMVNNYTSPPTATVRFQATINGKTKASSILNTIDTTFTVLVQFTDVGFVKEEDGNWCMTDRCVFTYRGGSSEDFRL